MVVGCLSFFFSLDVVRLLSLSLWVVCGLYCCSLLLFVDVCWLLLCLIVVVFLLLF